MKQRVPALVGTHCELCVACMVNCVRKCLVWLILKVISGSSGYFVNYVTDPVGYMTGSRNNFKLIALKLNYFTIFFWRLFSQRALMHSFFQKSLPTRHFFWNRKTPKKLVEAAILNKTDLIKFWLWLLILCKNYIGFWSFIEHNNNNNNNINNNNNNKNDNNNKINNNKGRRWASPLCNGTLRLNWCTQGLHGKFKLEILIEILIQNFNGNFNFIEKYSCAQGWHGKFKLIL